MSRWWAKRGEVGESGEKDEPMGETSWWSDVSHCEDVAEPAVLGRGSGGACGCACAWKTRAAVLVFK